MRIRVGIDLSKALLRRLSIAKPKGGALLSLKVVVEDLLRSNMSDFRHSISIAGSWDIMIVFAISC